MSGGGIRGVLEAAIYVRDLDETGAFYGDLLGLEEIVRSEGRHVFFRCGTTVLLCFIARASRQPTSNPVLPVPPHGAEGPGHVCFSVLRADIDEIRERIEAHGVEIEADFEWPNGARSIYVRDPSGNSVEIAESGLWGLE